MVTPNSLLICKIFSMSGTDCAPSHLETDCRVTFSCWASSSWEYPAFLRRAINLSAKIMVNVLSCVVGFCFGGFIVPAGAVAKKNLTVGNVSTAGCGHKIYRSIVYSTNISLQIVLPVCVLKILSSAFCAAALGTESSYRLTRKSASTRI